MSIADIEKVKGAEANAASIRKKAEEDVAQIIADGKKEAKSLLEAANKQAEISYKSAIAVAEGKANKLYGEIIEKQRAECEKIKEDGRKKQGGVVDDIVRKVVSI